MLVKVPNLAVPNGAPHFDIRTSFGTSRKPESKLLGLGTGHIFLKPNIAFNLNFDFCPFLLKLEIYYSINVGVYATLPNFKKNGEKPVT